jgi:glycosyltransferase involved in cell wall biosynthesis
MSHSQPSPLPRIAIDLEKLRHFNTGLGRFAFHLGTELLRQAEGRFRPVFLLKRGCECHFPQGGINPIWMAPWRKERFARYVRPLLRPFLPPPDVAVWHVTNQFSKYRPLDDRVPVVLTIHDLTFLYPTDGEPIAAPKIGRKLASVQRLVDRAAAVVTDARSVADDVAAHLRLGDRPLHVVPLGLSPPVPASTQRPAFLAPGPFLFTIGNCLPHKNFHVLFDLVERLPGRRVVIAGRNDTPYGGFLARELTRRRLEDRVVLAGQVHDADRQWLYENCEAFFFPSLTEGFGFPVLEAMQCGKPAFITRVTSLPEVAGDHAFYLDSFAPDAMAAAFEQGMATFHGDPGFGDRVRRHAAAFTWASTAREYIRIYGEVLGRRLG